uniref:Cytochrome P450 n=1 Tax=Fagus sylvatica TaxID=28930 RepID=A0A2N9GE59_FAGSY
MWTVGLCIVAVVVIYFSYWLNKWSNPKCNGVLPPGSMGLPLIGETLQWIVPSYSLDLHPFIKKRAQRRKVSLNYGPLDSFAKLFGQEGENKTNAVGLVHKYMRSLVLGHFGAESLKEKLLPQIEEFVNKTLQTWSSQNSIEVKHAASVMVFDFSAKQFFSYDAEKSQTNMAEKFTNTLGGFMSFPLNIPGTAYHKCLKVINEALRLGNAAPGLLRKALRDIEFKGYTIPSGWTIMLVNSAFQVNPNTFKDPLAFNPWRWKELDPLVVSKNFMPFGGGIRQCAGAEYSKTFMATFLHVLVTKYRSSVNLRLVVLFKRLRSSVNLWLVVLFKRLRSSVNLRLVVLFKRLRSSSVNLRLVVLFKRLRSSVNLWLVVLFKRLRSSVNLRLVVLFKRLRSSVNLRLVVLFKCLRSSVSL